MKGASLTGGGFGQTKLRGRRVRADEATRVAGFGKGEQRDGRGPDESSRATKRKGNRETERNGRDPDGRS